nr:MULTISPECIES: iron ABC transporter permease [unclassified Ruminococcus]
MSEVKFRYVAGFVMLTAAAVALFLLSLTVGSSSVTAGEALRQLFSPSSGLANTIVYQVRLPRAAAAMLLGGALSVSGFLLQSFFGNPIAGPFVLGVSSGAKLTVALTMIAALQNGFLLNSGMLVTAAFVGSLLSMGAVLLLSGRVKSMAQLIIAGVMIGYICSAVTELAVTFASDADIVNLHNWSQGSFSGTDMGDVKVMSAVVAFGTAAAFMLSKPMDAYRLGEGYAASLGVNIRLFRAALILLSSVLSACVTAFAGPVSFVGVAVPHLTKSIFGTAKPIIIIPAAFIGGGAFCLACDLIARSLFAPTELSVSTVTAVFGAPVVIFIMLRRERERRAG